MKKPNSILIVRVSSMGDIALTTHFIRVVRKAFPTAKIDYAIGAPFKDILKYNCRIDNLILYDKKADKSEIENQKKDILIRNGQYDIAFDLQSNFRSKSFISGLARERKKYPKNRIQKLSLVYLKKMFGEPIQPIPLEYLKSAENFPVADDGEGLEFWLESDYKSRKYLANEKKESNIIAIAPGAAHFTKQYPKENFLQIALKIIEQSRIDIKLIGGKDDFETCEFLASRLDGKAENLAGKTSILETAEILDKSALLITNDSGNMHIASARKTPVVAVFGSTTPSLGFPPFRVKSEIIEIDLPCRPCTHIGRKDCPKGHFNCMKLINPEIVAKKALKLIKQ